MQNRNKIISHFIFCGLVLTGISSCKKPDPPVPVIETGTVTDKDGNIYTTVKIGDQWWMAENLKVKTYRDSSAITIVPDNSNTTWDTISLGACCIYDDDATAPGRLYNWNAVNDPRGLAPTGWHVPSDAEWKQLETYLGMSQADADNVNFRGTIEGEKLKKEGENTWNPYGNTWNSNESKFSALAGNCRMFNGEWGDPSDLRSTGFWWSSTGHSSNNQAWYRHLDYKKSNVFRYYGSKNYGFSIRCVKD